jgi:hypothetical protein
MTTTSGPAYDRSRLDALLRAYADDPMEDGDAVLLLDDQVCLEVAHLADAWDERGRGKLVDLVTRTATRVTVAIARRGSELLPGDYLLWRQLHEDLRSTDVELRPVQALPAA